MYRKKKHINMTWVQFLLIGIVVTLFSIIIGIYMGLHLSQWNFVDLLLSIMPQNQLSPAENILVLGVDNGKKVRRSDTIMVLNVNRARKTVGLLSIPRDTRVELPKRGFTKINHAYAYGGVELVKSTVSRFLQIPIHYYVVVDLQGVRKIVDRVGGVDIDIKKRLYYIDKAGDLYIDFRPGRQVLSGQDVVEYLRFRKDSQGDIGRIGRQQKFLKSLAQRIIFSRQIFKMPQLTQDFLKNVNTNLNIGQIFNLSFEMREAIENNRIKVNTIPGSIVLIDGLSYWKADLPAAAKMIDETIHGYTSANVIEQKSLVVRTELGKAKKLSMAEVSKFMPEKEIIHNIYDEGVDIKIEVLNGNGINRIAAKTAAVLKSRGVEVPKIGDAAHHHYPNTIIVDWKGKSVESLTLAKALNINPINIVTYYKPQKSLDITLVLGKDINNLKIIGSTTDFN